MTILLLFKSFHCLCIIYRGKSKPLLWSPSLLFLVPFCNWHSAMHKLVVILWEHQVISKLLQFTLSQGVGMTFFDLHSITMTRVYLDSFQGESFTQSSDCVRYPFLVLLQHPLYISNMPLISLTITCYCFITWVIKPNPPTTMYRGQRMFLIYFCITTI